MNDVNFDWLSLGLAVSGIFIGFFFGVLFGIDYGIKVGKAVGLAMQQNAERQRKEWGQ